MNMYSSKTPVLAGIWSYPLKSGAGQQLSRAEVGDLGIDGDRRMMVVRPDGVALTARDYPAMLTIRSELVEQSGHWRIRLAAPGVEPLELAGDAYPPVTREVDIWGDAVRACAGFITADRWLRDYLGAECQLVVMGPQSHREMAGRPGQLFTFSDAAPLLLTSLASLSDLNQRLPTPVGMERFRPNLVIAGYPPFDEDAWQRVRIGDLEFDVDGACDRCVVITLDPVAPSGARRPDTLSALANYRRNAAGKVYFGQMLVPRSTGTVELGQRVAVLARRAAPVFSLPSAPKPDFIPYPLLAPWSCPKSLGERVRLRCTAVNDETHDVRSFHLVREDGAPFRFMPGQFLMLHGMLEGQAWTRCYSLSSSPSRSDSATITVKRVPGGVVSNWLHDAMQPGQVVESSGVGGTFHYLAQPARRMLLLSGGSGITPMMAMLRWIADTQLPVMVHFHHSARGHDDIIFLDELRALAAQMGDRLRISFNLDQCSQTYARALGLWSRVFHGRLDATMLAEMCDDIDVRTVFSCGPAPWMALVKDILHDRPGFPRSRLLEERFGAAAPGSVVAQPYQVHFAATGITLAGQEQISLLKLATQAGIDVASGCESGLCGACRCQIDSGKWGLTDGCADPERSILSIEEKRSGIVLACTTYPINDVVVNL